MIPLIFSPVSPTYAESISISACFSAISIDFFIDEIVFLIFTTTPLSKPSDLLSPNPRIFRLLFVFSAINTAILVVPISIPVIILGIAWTLKPELTT